MTGAALLATLRAPDAHPSKRRLVAILDAIWPTAGERDSWYVSALLGAVNDVLRGAAAPWLSRDERARVEGDRGDQVKALSHRREIREAIRG